jgi:hypothetical protein
MGANREAWASSRIRWSIWSVYAVAWTISLLVPRPSGSAHLTERIAGRVVNEQAAWKADQVLPFGSVVHVCAYALFAGLSGWLQVAPRWRWWLLALLIGHGALTEYLQWLLPTGRNGCVTDVGLDAIGILLGVALTWKWWFGGEGLRRLPG